MRKLMLPAAAIFVLLSTALHAQEKVDVSMMQKIKDCFILLKLNRITEP